MDQFHGSYKDDTMLAIPGADPSLGSAFRTVSATNGSLAVPIEVVNQSSDFSVELLFRPESQPDAGEGGIFIREQDLSFGFRFGVTDNAPNSSVFLKIWCYESGCPDDNKDGTNAGEEILGRQLLDFDRWYHIVMVHHSDHQFTMYVDGEMDAQGSLPIVSGQVSEFQTGFGIISGKSHDASFDEMAIYDRVLSPEEVREHAKVFLLSD